MCGIIGLFLKNPSMQPDLGRHAAAMLQVMSDRGPDSAGFAIYNEAGAAQVKLTVHDAAGTGRAKLQERLDAQLGFGIEQIRHSDHSVLIVPAQREEAVRAALATFAPAVRVVGSGHAMELYKGVGLPEAVSIRFGLPAMAGTHVIGHTRMATESAVTTAGAHPFSTGADQCLVHNGSLSNHNALRRKLAREGVPFETENDTEVAAGYLSWRLANGERLDAALDHALSDLDGFYTFVVGTRTGFGVLRDAIACKPAVMAETDDYVAFGTEYRALVDLPGIEDAHVFEPEPKRVYFWERSGVERAV